MLLTAVVFIKCGQPIANTLACRTRYRPTHYGHCTPFKLRCVYCCARNQSYVCHNYLSHISSRVHLDKRWSKGGFKSLISSYLTSSQLTCFHVNWLAAALWSDPVCRGCNTFGVMIPTPAVIAVAWLGRSVASVCLSVSLLLYDLESLFPVMWAKF